MLIKYDREIFLMGMKCKVRFIPSFEERYRTWDRKRTIDNNCPFCERWEGSIPSLIPDFHIILNDYPFMDNQFTLFGEDHCHSLTAKQISLAVKLVSDMDACKSGGIQFLGSGASVPQHAHFSISDESYPISELKRDVLFISEKYKISRILDVPHLALVVQGDIDSIGSVTIKILLNLWNQKFSYNVLLTEEQEIIIIPRTHEISETLGRKVGVSLVGGVYPCYIKSVNTQLGYENILDDMLEHWEAVTSADLIQAIRETTISSNLELQEILSLLGVSINS